MDILFLSPRLPLPADTGGKIRTFNILKQAAKTNRVRLLCFSFEEGDRNYISDFGKLGVEVTLVGIEEPALFQKVSAVLFNPLPFSIAKYDSSRMRQAIEKILEKESFDAVHIDHLHMAHYAGCFRNIPCMLDEHNVEYRLLEHCARHEASIIKKILYQQQAAKMKAFEARKTKEFKVIFACSSDDQKILQSMTPARVQVIANGVDTEYFDPSRQKEPVEENTMVFTGSMDWLPNDDAVTYFCAKILPLIWQHIQSVKFYVVGKNPSDLVKDLAGRDPRVIVTGRVEDVRPYVGRSAVFIVPLRIGGGTRLKILEAMSMGRAVVSTAIGAEGIECAPGQNILLADDPQGFADKILWLLNNPQQAQKIGLAGSCLVRNRYDWNTIGQKLKTIYEEACLDSKK